MKKIYLLPLLALLQVLPLRAENIIRFREGIAISNSQQYGRQAMFTDQLAARMFAPGYAAPKAGAVLYTNDRGQEVVWKEIKADSAGRFTGREGANGYIYISYTSLREGGGVLTISGNSMFYWNGEPHAGDVYNSGYLHTPVHIRKGVNELYIRTSGFMRPGITAELLIPDQPVLLRTDDPTLPHIVPGRDSRSMLGAVVLINAGSKPLKGLSIRSELQGRTLTETVPAIPPYTLRKVAFRFDGSAVTGKGSHPCKLVVESKGKPVAQAEVAVESVSAGEPYSCTFISGIDGSVQYYAVNPQSGDTGKPGALFLSVHGAGVEAIGQARAYRAKDWGNLVAPTNRRPRGFNWEDWGRLDALEVLDIARKEYQPDPQKIYLTGHSMGGHGTWFLGATYPDKWAAIAPCAGYASLMAYASADGKIPQPGENINEQNLYRASNGSNVPELVRNYMGHGVYVHHGDADPTVSVEYARQMRKLLGEFHPDFAYYEYPGGNHWWSNESVDWPPLFEFFRSHVIRPDSVVNHIEFRTANPAVSASNRWVSILQQAEPLKYSTIKVDRDRKKGTFTGTTENISILSLQTTGITTDKIKISLDGQDLTVDRPAQGEQIILVKKDTWTVGSAPGSEDKGTVRNGTFKEPFNYRMVFVYGTTGTKEENAWAIAKARYDAETWYYRGNGAVDMVADRDFIPSAYPDRGVILYGNATTNSSWKLLMSKAPIQVSRGSVMIGTQELKGDGYGAFLMYPRPDSQIASVGAVTGTGLPGMHAADANQYFSGGSGFLDYLIFTSELPAKGIQAVVQAGFYGNGWGL
jgi:dienelactone hydrolase